MPRNRRPRTTATTATTARTTRTTATASPATAGGGTATPAPAAATPRVRTTNQKVIVGAIVLAVALGASWGVKKMFTSDPAVAPQTTQAVQAGQTTQKAAPVAEPLPSEIKKATGTDTCVLLELGEYNLTIKKDEWSRRYCFPSKMMVDQEVVKDAAVRNYVVETPNGKFLINAAGGKIEGEVPWMRFLAFDREQEVRVRIY